MTKKIVTFMSFLAFSTLLIPTAEAGKKKEEEQLPAAKRHLFPESTAAKIFKKTKPMNNKTAVRSANTTRVKVIEKENPFLAENLRKETRNRRLPKPSFKGIQVH